MMLKFFVLFASLPLIVSEEFFISPCHDEDEKIPWQSAINAGFRNYILNTTGVWSPVNYNCYFEEDLKKILSHSRIPVVFRFQIRNGPKLHSNDVTRMVFETLKEMKKQESYPKDPILSELEKVLIFKP
ncbi:unnamed protein product [Cylicocyclus nassatus]|uniref:Uncharacterized protein n=1 Tax=Cylicocyclus nassatus TaxID=53992 RepID=A0AA36DQ74_CYLNA|nr:unnamed protein product [Cylicocyclus nassatus]